MIKVERKDDRGLVEYIEYSYNRGATAFFQEAPPEIREGLRTGDYLKFTGEAWEVVVYEDEDAADEEKESDAIYYLSEEEAREAALNYDWADFYEVFFIKAVRQEKGEIPGGLFND